MEGQVTEVEQKATVTKNNHSFSFIGHNNQNNDLLVLKQ